MTIGSPAAGRPRLAALLAGGAALVTVLILLPFVLNGLLLDLVLNVMSTVMSAAAGFACLRAARRVIGPTRRGWFAIALACWVWAVSDLLWAVSVDLLGIELRYPSVVELGYLIFPVACLLGLRWLAAGPSGLTATSAGARRADGRLRARAGRLGGRAGHRRRPASGSVLASALCRCTTCWPTSCWSPWWCWRSRSSAANLLRWALLGAGVVMLAFTDHAFAYLLAGSFRGGTSFAWGLVDQLRADRRRPRWSRPGRAAGGHGPLRRVAVGPGCCPTCRWSRRPP